MLSEAERLTLESWAKRRSTAQELAVRARIVRACTNGWNNTVVAVRLGVGRDTVRRWRTRFLARRLDGLADEPRPGVPRTITDAQVEEVVVRTVEQTPPGGTHWSKRELAKVEKPQIQALERTAPVLPMISGVPERRSFDYVRHGTVDLFAALNTATGKVITKLSAQHRAVDFRDFLDEIDRQTDKSLAVHVICDNLSARKAPVVHKWLLAHPCFQLHFTPTYSSWINQVERWFAELERRCLTRGVFCSLDDLKTALEEWIKVWNDDARPFKWTKTFSRHTPTRPDTPEGQPFRFRIISGA